MTPEDQGILLARIDERTARMEADLKSHLDKDDVVHKELRDKIQANTKFRWLASGFAGLCVAGVGFLQLLAGD